MALLPDMEGPLVLDFTGVRSASSSFFDELLGRLAEEMGPDAFHAKVRVTGLNPVLTRMAEVTIGQRLGKE